MSFGMDSLILLKWKKLKAVVEKGLKDSHIQSWKTRDDEMSKSLNYRMYKTEYQSENCFAKLLLN